eukprot:6552642-Pyramimonas_sp.AAC.1
MRPRACPRARARASTGSTSTSALRSNLTDTWLAVPTQTLSVSTPGGGLPPAGPAATSTASLPPSRSRSPARGLRAP